MKSSKVSDFFIFGYFGHVTNKLDGQTVKTRSIHRLFEENLSTEIQFYDTEELKRSNFSLFHALLCIKKCKMLIYIPAGNSIKYFFPFLFVLSKIFRFQIIYFVVGGWLPKLVGTYPYLKILLSRISNIFVETTLMQQKLTKEFEYKNVSVFPNFRFVELNQSKPNYSVNSTFKVVFMSRINRKKGLELIFNYAKVAPDNVTIDFYGPVNEHDKNYFYSNIEVNSNTKYKGILKHEEINKTLAEYDVLVLPTMYFTEGLPGAIVDAYFAGIPVVVTEWIHAKEFVLDGETGFIIPFQHGLESFIERLNLLDRNRILLNQLKNNAYAFSSKFNSANAWSIINEKLLQQ